MAVILDYVSVTSLVDGNDPENSVISSNVNSFEKRIFERDNKIKFISFEYIRKNEKGDTQLNLVFSKTQSLWQKLWKEVPEFYEKSFIKDDYTWHDLTPEIPCIISSQFLDDMREAGKNKLWYNTYEKQEKEKVAEIRNKYNVKEKLTGTLDILE